MLKNTRASRAAKSEAQRVGQELRRARRAADLTQTDVAARAKCSQSSVVRAESGLSLAPALLKRIAAAVLALGSKPDDSRP